MNEANIQTGSVMTALLSSSKLKENLTELHIIVRTTNWLMHFIQTSLFTNQGSIRPSKWEKWRESPVLVVLLAGSTDTGLGRVEGPASE